MTIDFAGSTNPENNPSCCKELVLTKFPEAHAHLDPDAGYIILSDKTEDAICLGYFEETKDEAWESALADIEDEKNADFEDWDHDDEEEGDEDED